MGSLLQASTAGSRTSLEVSDKGKPGESRRRKATRLPRVSARHASRAADSHFRGGRILMRTLFLAVTGLFIAVTACSEGGTSVLPVERTPVAAVALSIPASALVVGQTAHGTA